MARRRKKRRTPVVIGLIVVAVVVYWFFVRDTDQGIEIELTAEASVEDDLLALSGTTNLPNDAVLLYQLTPEMDDEPALQGTTTVVAGEFSENVDVSDVPEGDITVEVIFQPVLDDVPQPPEIVETYGALGQNISGDQVVEGELGRRVEVSVTVSRP